ncbi:hypothetical protein SGRA_2557 [Saprospira grandis str. Lewin]|uniref:Uncharacterized protein n=1 Tax=Saprospira grandis (strain Lewin) TaxID=984262 RepID=H6L6N9_SAPGL|nr:hypothetical protein SGRA_2557 [Saprospira grandis str. Lewin]
MLWADGFNHRLIFIAPSIASFVAVGFNPQVL